MSEVAIVTGASSGIGEELARLLAARGLTVLAVARRAERLQALAVATENIVPFTCDVTRPAAATEILARAQELGTIAWLVNNAGTSKVGEFVATAPETLDNIVRLNCEAPVALTRAIAPILVAAGKGRIVNIASLAGFQPTPYQAAYGASKAFMLSLSEALAEELRGTGVTVTAVCPGPVSTEIFEHMGVAGGRKPPAHEISALDCARAALAAADAERVIVIPGVMNKLSAIMGKLAPRSLVRRSAARFGLRFIGVETLPR
jgi:uncharacterized protein